MNSLRQTSRSSACLHCAWTCAPGAMGCERALCLPRGRKPPDPPKVAQRKPILNGPGCPPRHNSHNRRRVLCTGDCAPGSRLLMDIRHIAFAVLPLLFAAPCAAQDSAEFFPSRAIRMVVPFPAGGPTDILVRVVAQRMSDSWKQPVVVENQPG